MNWFQNGTVRTIALIGSKRPPELANVPLLVDLAQDPDTQRLLSQPPSLTPAGLPAVTVLTHRQTHTRHGGVWRDDVGP